MRQPPTLCSPPFVVTAHLAYGSTGGLVVGSPLTQAPDLLSLGFSTWHNPLLWIQHECAICPKLLAAGSSASGRHPWRCDAWIEVTSWW